MSFIKLDTYSYRATGHIMLGDKAIVNTDLISDAYINVKYPDYCTISFCGIEDVGYTVKLSDLQSLIEIKEKK